MRRLGLEPRSRILELQVEEADPQVVQRMRLPETNRRVTRIPLVRIVIKVPILLATSNTLRDNQAAGAGPGKHS